MWQTNWRSKIWNQLDKSEWDILVIGGGITGAGILREATRLGLRALLVEQRDFAWGTSSRSSKLVHGGFRYLKEGRILLTRASVQERDQLVQDAPGLIDPLGFLMTVYKGDFPGRWVMSMGLTVYDLLALRWDHQHYSPEDFRMLAPHVASEGLECGFRYGDAQTDDARLVLRVIREAVADGGTAINYTSASGLVWEENPANGQKEVVGAELKDMETGQKANLRARLVVNATGAWADRLREAAGQTSRIRPLRGSHLIFPAWRLPAAQALSFWHPIDGRPVFIFPWEGATLVGTTDVDHNTPLDQEPNISSEEVAYLMAAVDAQFPSLGLSLDDVVSTFSGVRPVIGSGKANPSEESRDHVVWDENGLLTVTGGKLTTFRLIAHDVLKVAVDRFENLPPPDPDLPVLKPVDMDELDKVDVDSAVGNRRKSISDRVRFLNTAMRRRLLGSYGSEALPLIESAQEGELKPITGTNMLWAELRWAARSEGVVHLDDLLLRRVRLGLLLPKGGQDLLPEIRRICQPELGWDDQRWEDEQAAYQELWQRCYNLPRADTIPDWKAALARARRRKAAQVPIRQRKIIGGSALAGGLLALAAVLTVYAIRSRKGKRQQAA